MNLKKTRIILLLTFIVLPLITLSQDYFDRYKSLADSLEDVYSVPSALMLAVAYHESGGGKSKVAKHSNNHFGIKGKNHKVKSAYRYFDDVVDSYVAFCKLVTSKKFYNNVKGSDDVKKWVRGLSNSGYASNSSTWSNKIIQIIKTNKLD
jgi:Bax protein